MTTEYKNSTMLALLKLYQEHEDDEYITKICRALFDYAHYKTLSI